MSGLLDLLTGGSNENAQGDLAAALQNVENVQTPDTAQLQLSPLAQYTDTGDLQAALANAAQAGPSAYDSENISSVPMATMQQALAQEGEIANAQGMTPQEKASIAQAEETVNENTAGQRGAIAQSFAGMGVPQSLISAALQNGTAGQEAEQLYQNALQAQGQAANQGITALQNEGTLAGQMYGQQAGQANTVAAAQNALNQFNAANTQQTNLANQANQQAANTYNTQNAQNIANQNVAGQQTVQEQNQVNAPQEAAQLALEKSGQEVGVGESQANQQTAVGQQNAGLIGGLVGAAGNVAGGYASGAALGSAIAAAEGGEIPPKSTVAPTTFLRGGPVPGQARVAGDSPRNDTVPARLSPGEFVVPRSVAQQPGIKNFLANAVPNKPPSGAHPSDIKSIIRALSELRAGV
jgi:hypothetical protein